jgi:hypothetical protein
VNEEKPYWTDTLLQGLAYWVGYKNQLYPFHPLTEGAIVGEAVALLKNSFKLGEILECEKMYKDLGADGFGAKRADLVITKAENEKIVVEVKRYSPSLGKIEQDFERLAMFNFQHPQTRCFLLVVSQKKKPEKFVTEEGNAKKAKISNNTYVTTVRRVCKASASFKNVGSAHYACLIEVESVDYSEKL